MNGGTYARAQQAGFNKTQASFFANFGMDLKDECAERLRDEVEKIKLQLTLRNRISTKLIKLAKWIQK